MDIIEFSGEYGVELGVFIPYINYLKHHNLLNGRKVKTYNGMRPYYFFLSDEEYIEKDKSEKRRWIPPQYRYFLPENIKDDDKVYSKYEVPSMYLPPDYYTFYKSQYIVSNKPIFIIQNKYNMEWGDPPLNFFDVEQLEKILNILSKKFTVVYFRTNNFNNGNSGYSTDHNEAESYTLGDKEMIKEKWSDKDVLLIEDMVEKLNIDFNKLKLLLLANSKYTLSTFGGINFSDAYFPCEHLVFVRKLPQQFDQQFLQNMHNLLVTRSTDNKFRDIFFTYNFKDLVTKLQSL